MKTSLVLALIFVATQATEVIRHEDVHPVEKRINPKEDAPSYPDSRIISGIQASRGQFPYQAALYLDGGSFCGGSLISQRWVLTAAHCAYGVNTFTVYLGAQNLNAVTEDGRVVLTTRSKIVHSRYIPLLAPNDIALVNLEQDVPLSNLVQPISLASGSDQFEGVAARVSGWGKISDASNSVNPQLSYADILVISNAVCRQTFGSLNVRASTICTQGSNGRSVCNGDSGGPLIELSSGKQIGIVSYVSSEGCESGNPNGYARVTSFIDWISQNTGLAF